MADWWNDRVEVMRLRPRMELTRRNMANIDRLQESSHTAADQARSERDH